MTGDQMNQRDAALERANVIRRERATAKLVVGNVGDRATGYPELAAILQKPPRELAGARVTDVISAARGVGTTRSLTVCARVRVSPTQQLRRISAARRAELARALQPAASTLRNSDQRERPLVATGMIAALIGTGLRAHEVAHWFTTPRAELAGRSPRQALRDGEPGDAQRVLELAREDAHDLTADTENAAHA